MPPPTNKAAEAKQIDAWSQLFLTNSSMSGYTACSLRLCYLYQVLVRDASMAGSVLGSGYRRLWLINLAVRIMRTCKVMFAANETLDMPTFELIQVLTIHHASRQDFLAKLDVFMCALPHACYNAAVFYVYPPVRSSPDPDPCSESGAIRAVDKPADLENLSTIRVLAPGVQLAFDKARSADRPVFVLSHTRPHSHSSSESMLVIDYIHCIELIGNELL